MAYFRHFNDNNGNVIKTDLARELGLTISVLTNILREPAVASHVAVLEDYVKMSRGVGAVCTQLEIVEGLKEIANDKRTTTDKFGKEVYMTDPKTRKECWEDLAKIMAVPGFEPKQVKPDPAKVPAIGISIDGNAVSDEFKEITKIANGQSKARHGLEDTEIMD
jgi:hypothetical protein